MTNVDIYSLRTLDKADSGRMKLLLQLVDLLPVLGMRPTMVQREESQGAVRAFAFGAIRWLAHLARLDILPLQSIMALRVTFAKRSGPIALIDGVRLVSLLTDSGIRKKYERVAVDFDDLLSRRLGRMTRFSEPVPLGAYEKHFPSPIKFIINKFSDSLLKIEKKLVRRSEILCAKSADIIFFTSAHERDLFSRFLRRFTTIRGKELRVLGPVFNPKENSDNSSAENIKPEQVRLIFIGTDGLYQNKISIDAIEEHDGIHKIPVIIYGSMKLHRESRNNLRFAGFAESLEEVYTRGSILYMPAAVKGGIKTKIIEAFAHGVPVLASSEAFEGFEPGYIWAGCEAEADMLDMDMLIDQYDKAVNSGIQVCYKTFSRERYLSELETLSGM